MVVFFAGDVRAVVLGDDFVAAFVVLAVDFFAVDRVAVFAVVLGAAFVVDFDADLLAVDLAAVLPVDLVAVLAVLDFAAVFGAAFVVLDFAVLDFAAVFGAAFVVLDFAVLDFAVDFGAAFVAVLLAGAFAVRVEAGRVVVAPLVLLVVVRVDVGRVAAVFAVPAVRDDVDVVELRFAVVAFGSFLEPLTTSLKVVPARKAGTLVFFTFTVSPVRGFLAVRAARARFSNTPKPVMLTFSPLLTVRMMMSTRLSTASDATFLSPKRSESASMSWALLAIPVLPRRTTCYPATPADMRTRYYQRSTNSKRHAVFFLIVCAVTPHDEPSRAAFACRSAWVPTVVHGLASPDSRCSAGRIRAFVTSAW